MKKSLIALSSSEPKPKPSPPPSFLTQQPKRQKLRGRLFAASEALLLSIFNYAACVLDTVGFVYFIILSFGFCNTILLTHIKTHSASEVRELLLF